MTARSYPNTGRKMWGGQRLGKRNGEKVGKHFPNRFVFTA